MSKHAGKRSMRVPALAAWGRFLRRPEFVLGAWLNTFLAAMIIGHSRQPALLFVALVAGAAAVVVLTWGLPARHRIDPLTEWGSLVLLAAILAGYAVNLDRYEGSFVVANFTSIVLALGMAYLLATRLDLDWRLLLACHAVVALLLIPLPVAGGELVWGRLVPGGLHPNYLGMIAMVAFIGALGIRPRMLRWLVLLATTGVMAAVSSRGSMVAAGVAALGYTAAAAPPRAPALAGARTIHAALAVLCLVAGALALWMLDAAWLTRAGDVLFKINDPYRGLESGASGRTEAWTAALALWNAQPMLGVGFKGHTFLMPHSMTAHNAYLAMLAETGAVGMAGYLTLCGAAVAGLWRQRRNPRNGAAIALVASYLVYGLVETRAVGFGNPYSILFLWVAFDAARRPTAEPVRVSRSRALQPRPASRPEGSPP